MSHAGKKQFVKCGAAILLGAVAVIGVATLLVSGKPLHQREISKPSKEPTNFESRDHEDPLVALPSGQYELRHAPEVHEAPKSLESEYEAARAAAGSELPSGEPAMAELHRNGQPKREHQIVYEMRHEPQEYYASQPAENGAPAVVAATETKPCDHQASQAAAEQQAEPQAEPQVEPQAEPQAEPQLEPQVEPTVASDGYPAELTYIDQYGRTTRVQTSGHRGAEPGSAAAAAAGPSIESDVSQAADSIIRNSGMPATILTEVPAGDITPEVLEALKRDYGVKVVATRDYPGANLVLHCDDYPTFDGSLCAKQVHSNVGPSQQPPVDYSTREQQPTSPYESHFQTYPELTPGAEPEVIYRSASQESKVVAQPEQRTASAPSEPNRSEANNQSERLLNVQTADKLQPQQQQQQQQQVSVLTAKRQQKQAA